MKTFNLGKVDLYFQYILATLNALITMVGFAAPHFFLLLALLQIFINIYHFFTNLIHLQAQHRSIGYTKYRVGYLWLTIIYVPTAAIITWLIAETQMEQLLDVFLLVVWLVIPQIVIYLYTYLCTEEIDFIEHNEFHILK